MAPKACILINDYIVMMMSEISLASEAKIFASTGVLSMWRECETSLFTPGRLRWIESTGT